MVGIAFHPKKIFLFSFLLFILIGSISPSLASSSDAHVDGNEEGAGAFKQLKIETFKRKLRLSEKGKNPLSSLPALLKAYEENRFKTVVDQIGVIPEGKRDAAIFLLDGNALLFLDEKEKAVEAYQKAYRGAASPQERAAAMADFALAFSTKGAWKEAAVWMEKALEIDRQTGDRLAEGADLSLLGTFYYRAGDNQKGSSAHFEALKIAESLSDLRLQAEEFSSIGALYYLDGEKERALEYHQKALNLYRALHDPLGEAASHVSLSFVYKDQKQFDPALNHLSDALAFHRRWEDRTAEANDLINVGLIRQEQGKIREAIETAERALQIQEALGNINGMAQAEGTIGLFHQTGGNLPEAIRHLEKARDLFRKGGASQEIHIVDLKIQTLRDQIKE